MNPCFQSSQKQIFDVGNFTSHNVWLLLAKEEDPSLVVGPIPDVYFPS